MKSVLRIFKLLLFFAALTFAVKNTDSVTVRYYLGAEWQAPLIFVLLVVFCLGALAGVTAMLAQVVRLRRELARLRKQTQKDQANRDKANSGPGDTVPVARPLPPDIPDAV